MAEAWSDPPKVDQTEFDPEGNCRSACLATLLRVSLSEVPNFNCASAGRAERRRAQIGWLTARGWSLINFSGANPNERWTPWPPSKGFCIADGISPRGNRHSVIYRDGALWHDPHPDRTGLVDVDQIEFLRPLYPGGLQRIV